MLTDEQIKNLWVPHYSDPLADYSEFARAIEAAVLEKLREGVELPEPFGYVRDICAPGNYGATTTIWARGTQPASSIALIALADAIDYGDRRAAAIVPEGYVVVPVEPTEDMWMHLARDIVFWLYTCPAPHNGSKMHEFLLNLGTTIPEWLSKEIPDSDSTPPKGTVAVCIYRAMLEAAPKEQP